MTQAYSILGNQFKSVCFLLGHTVFCPVSYIIILIDPQGGCRRELRHATVYRSPRGNVYPHDEARLGKNEKLVREKLGRELTPREKFYLAMADSCGARMPKPLILCIEDNAKHLQLRKAVLEKAGYSVLGANTGAEALEMVREAPICLVLSDHMLSGTTGTALAREIKQIKQDLPVVLHSGSVPESMENVDGFINKNEPVSTFLALIHDFIRRYLE